MNLLGIWILNVVDPSEPVRAPSQVLASAQPVAACAGVNAGAATSRSPAAATAATMRRVNVFFMSIPIYGSSLDVGAPGRNVAFLAVPVAALVAVRM